MGVPWSPGIPRVPPEIPGFHPGIPGVFNDHPRVPPGIPVVFNETHGKASAKLRRSCGKASIGGSARGHAQASRRAPRGSFADARVPSLYLQGSPPTQGGSKGPQWVQGDPTGGSKGPRGVPMGILWDPT